jgi:glycerophosphoryl diester phosphodiesterase
MPAPDGDRSPALRRVGHKGADHIAPGNTPESFDAALEAGVDMIEFDVLPERGSGRLLLAHDYEDAARRQPLTLEQGLDHLASEPFGGLELDVDLKLPGYEERVVSALLERRLAARALISTQYPESLARLRALAPELRLGWSLPKVKRDYTRSRWTAVPALGVAQLIRHTLPSRAEAALRARRCDALMVHWRLVSARLVRAVRSAGGELYVWTVDDAQRIAALEALGVTGVITNDPRLFESGRG